ncbi:DUF4303 domain-containing protein [Flavobacterium pedocola]
MAKQWWQFWVPKTPKSENVQDVFWNSEKWDNLKISIKTAVSENVTKLKSEHPDLYAYAIHPGDEYEVNELVPSYNTLSKIKSDDAYYKYSVDEWDNYDTTALNALNPLFTEINNDFRITFSHLERETDAMYDEEAKLFTKFMGVILSALKELKAENSVFNFNTGNDFVVIWFSDSDSKWIIKAVEELNSKEVHEEFSALWFCT